MTKAVWILQVVLALVFVAAGTAKLFTPRDLLLQDPRMAWTQDFSETQIKLIGTAEVLGAVGLIVPAATGIVPVLTIAAALGLALLMDGATVTHVMRGEPFIAPVVLSALCMTVAGLRIVLRVRARQGAVR